MPLPKCSGLILFLGFAIAGVGAKIFVNIVNDGDKSELGSVWCHEDLMRNFTEQVLKLQSDQANAQQQLGALHDSLRHIEVLLARKQLTSDWQLQTLPSSCADALESSVNKGVRRIYLPTSGLEPFNVFCLRDPAIGDAAWTVVQRREDGATDFNRGWDSHVRGFGNVSADYFVGLERLHAFTHSTEQELWIQVEDSDGSKSSALYASFAIGDERAKFALDVLGDYSGDAGDSLRDHFGHKFSTKDADNRGEPVTCPVTYTGGWWYNNCNLSNPNILRKNMIWSWSESSSLKYIHMAIRPTIISKRDPVHLVPS